MEFRAGLGYLPLLPCPHCHHLNPAGAAWCQRCGASLSSAARVATSRVIQVGAHLPTEATLALGARYLERYQIEVVLGSGGMSTVYQALDHKLGRRVALKVLNAELSRDWKARERLAREANALGRVRHPHVLQIHDVLELDGALALAVELVTGGTLATLLERGPLAPTAVSSLMARILDGLAAIHAAGLVHRDLKPGNVLITPEGQPKLADLGIARDPDAALLTTPGAILGTPAYMSPEQIRGLTLGPESDIYACGVMLFEMLTGTVPFDAERDREVLAAHLTTPPPLAKLPASTPAELRRVVAQALEKDPTRRFATAVAMRSALPGSNEVQVDTTTAPHPGLGRGLAEGTRVGEYLVRRLVGEGGMGQVYEAEERLTGRRVALKVLRAEIARSDSARRLFLTEMAVLAGLDHPNVVRSLACTEVGGDLVLVLELLGGQTLRERLQTGGALDPGSAARIALQIARALERAHGLTPPVVHRDLKPENVMLAPDGGVKVMDFGIAKVLDSMSRTSTLSVGTLAYLSPEQIDARAVDARTDLYALGLLVYEMLAGAAPFAAASTRELLNLQCTAPPPALPPAVVAAAPPELLVLVARLLAKDPAARPESAAAVSEVLERCAATAPAAGWGAALGAGAPAAAAPSAAATHSSAAALHVPSPTASAQRRGTNLPTGVAIAIVVALSAGAGVATYVVRTVAGAVVRARAPASAASTTATESAAGTAPHR